MLTGIMETSCQRSARGGSFFVIQHAVSIRIEFIQQLAIPLSADYFARSFAFLFIKVTVAVRIEPLK